MCNLSRGNMPCGRHLIKINVILIYELVGEKSKVYGQDVYINILNHRVVIAGACGLNKNMHLTNIHYFLLSRNTKTLF